MENKQAKELKPWRIHQSQPYFYHDPEGDGFMYFSSEKERDEEAKKVIEAYLDDDGWPEEVVNVTCGTLTGRAGRVDVHYRQGDIDEDGLDESGEYWDSDWEYKCNYALTPFIQVKG